MLQQKLKLAVGPIGGPADRGDQDHEGLTREEIAIEDGMLEI